MKRAWKIGAVALAVPAACLGLLATDSYFRAVAAIREHDSRLREDIQALRSKSASQANSAWTYEQGQVGQMNLWNRRTQAPSRDAIVCLDQTEEMFREGGYTAFGYRCYHERIDLVGLRDLLARERWSPAQLRQLAEELEKRVGRRPALADVVRAEQLLDRAEVLNVLHLKRDPYCMLRRAPGWKEFFSWRILIAKSLHQLEDHYREVSGTAPARPQSEDLTRSALRNGASRLEPAERQTRAQWKFTQLAVALEIFVEENKRVPVELKDVFPDPPRSPFDGAPYEYKDAVLRDVGAKIVFPVRVR